MTEPFNAAGERSRFLYASAQAAKRRGDNASACALLEELLPLLEPAGELQSKHVVLHSCSPKQSPTLSRSSSGAKLSHSPKPEATYSTHR